MLEQTKSILELVVDFGAAVEKAALFTESKEDREQHRADARKIYAQITSTVTALEERPAG